MPAIMDNMTYLSAADKRPMVMQQTTKAEIDKVDAFERRIIEDTKRGKSEMPANAAGIESYTRFYIVKPNGSVMAIFKSVTSGVDQSLYDGRAHIVENFSMLPLGGDCRNTLYVNVNDFPYGDYKITCGAR